MKIKASEKELNEIIKNVANLPDAHNSQRAAQQLMGTRILVNSIERFSSTSTFLAWAMILISLITLVVSLFSIYKK